MWYAAVTLRTFRNMTKTAMATFQERNSQVPSPRLRCLLPIAKELDVAMVRLQLGREPEGADLDALLGLLDRNADGR